MRGAVRHAAMAQLWLAITQAITCPTSQVAKRPKPNTFTKDMSLGFRVEGLGLGVYSWGLNTWDLRSGNQGNYMKSPCLDPKPKTLYPKGFNESGRTAWERKGPAQATQMVSTAATLRALAENVHAVCYTGY